MSTYRPVLGTAIVNRLLADTGTGGLFAPGNFLVTSVYWSMLPSENALPAISINETSCVQRDATNCRTDMVGIDVHTWIARTPAVTSTITDPFERGAQVMARVIGNWPTMGTGVQPTYGLDRWRPDTSSTGWLSDNLMRLYEREDHDDETLHFILSLNVLVSEEAA